MDPADPDYQQKMFDKAKHKLRFSEGMRVRASGSRNCGTITKVYYELKDVIWQNDKPHFIEVELDNGDCWSYNPHQLSTKRVTQKASE